MKIRGREVRLFATTVAAIGWLIVVSAMPALGQESAGEPGRGSDGPNPFADVPTGAFYERAVRWAVAAGVTSGRTATRFDPDGPTTREQLAALTEARTAQLRQWLAAEEGDVCTGSRIVQERLPNR